MQQFDSRAAIPPVIDVRMFSLDKEEMRGQESKSDTFCKYLKERGIRAGLDIKEGQLGPSRAGQATLLQV